MIRSISYTLTAEDVLAGYRANFVETLRSKRIARSYILGSAFIGGGVGVAAWLFDAGFEPVVFAMGVGYWVFVLTAILLAGYLRMPRQVRRIYDQQKALHDVTAFEWSDDGVAFSTARGDTRYAWADFLKVIAGRDVIMLYQSEAMFNAIPRRVLTAEQSDDLARFARR